MNKIKKNKKSSLPTNKKETNTMSKDKKAAKKAKKAKPAVKKVEVQWIVAVGTTSPVFAVKGKEGWKVIDAQAQAHEIIECQRIAIAEGELVAGFAKAANLTPEKAAAQVAKQQPLFDSLEDGGMYEVLGGAKLQLQPYEADEEDDEEDDEDEEDDDEDEEEDDEEDDEEADEDEEEDDDEEDDDDDDEEDDDEEADEDEEEDDDEEADEDEDDEEADEDEEDEDDEDLSSLARPTLLARLKSRGLQARRNTSDAIVIKGIRLADSGKSPDEVAAKYPQLQVYGGVTSSPAASQPALSKAFDVDALAQKIAELVLKGLNPSAPKEETKPAKEETTKPAVKKKGKKKPKKA